MTMLHCGLIEYVFLTFSNNYYRVSMIRIGTVSLTCYSRHDHRLVNSTMGRDQRGQTLGHRLVNSTNWARNQILVQIQSTLPLAGTRVVAIINVCTVYYSRVFSFDDCFTTLKNYRRYLYISTYYPN